MRVGLQSSATVFIKKGEGTGPSRQISGGWGLKVLGTGFPSGVRKPIWN